MDINLIVITGPTASGKTRLAAILAEKINGEIISADSRQVYKNMTIGTGKDLSDYIVNYKNIPFHLIDIHPPGYKYNVFEFQKDFIKVFNEIRDNNHLPILCGGTGMYIESVLKEYQLLEVPADITLRNELEQKPMQELINILQSYKTLHNNTDYDTKKRIIRAIEIEKYIHKNKDYKINFPELNYVIFGVRYDRTTEKQRITNRLKERLENGMIEEVKSLLDSGINPEDLIYYGLEYKFVTQHITGIISHSEMFEKLNIAIHQFSKRQMTWFRRMERNGFTINWLNENLSVEEKANEIIKTLNSKA